MYHPKPLAMIMLSLGLWLAALPATALESDRKQPINIKADRITINEKKGFSHYQGNVVIVQGTLRVTGDDVTVYMQDDILKRIIVIGNPATFQQQPEEGKKLVKSRAGKMEYDVNKNLLYLRHKAEVEQGLNHFSGDYLQYNTRTSTISGRKSDRGDERVNITIVPQEKSNETKEQP